MKVINNVDRPLLAVTGFLLIFGLIFLASASSVIGFDKFHDSYYYIKRQILFGVLPGLAFGYVILKFGYRSLAKVSVLFFIGSVILLLMVFIPGVGQSYSTFAHRWINVGFIRFQPSEIAKLAMVSYLAAWLSQRSRDLNDFKHGFLPFVALVSLICGLIILEPDMGTAGIVGLTSFLMYFAANGRLRYLFLLVAVAVTLLGMLIAIEPYRLDRLATFMDSSRDPQGAGYHVKQSYLAIGSGGLWGRGLGESRAKFEYLPEVTGDSIFPIVAEELGFFGASLLVSLYVYFFWRVAKVARDCSYGYGKMMALGIGIWITVQSLVNLSAMVGLMPLTGVPLPFVSYGGTALMMTLIGVSIILSVSTDQRVNTSR